MYHELIDMADLHMKYLLCEHNGKNSRTKFLIQFEKSVFIKENVFFM